MNTIDKKLKNVKEFINEDASLDPSALESFANSKKVYIDCNNKKYSIIH